MRCECEAGALDKAVSQAEHKMMDQVFSDIRSWVRAHAQDYILALFTQLTTRRKALHAITLARINERAYHYHRLPPHPSEIRTAEDDLKRGIDEDWKASVQRYPEVLEYFYGLVELSLPGEEEIRVSDPPLSAMAGGKGRVRIRERVVERAEGRQRERRRSRIDDGRESRVDDGRRDRGERGERGERRGVQFAPMPEYNYVNAPRSPRY